MSSFLTKAGKLLIRNGRLLVASDPKNCDCCGTGRCCIECVQSRLIDSCDECPPPFQCYQRPDLPGKFQCLYVKEFRCGDNDDLIATMDQCIADGGMDTSSDCSTPPLPLPPCPPGRFPAWTPMGNCTCAPVCVDSCDGYPYDCTSEQSCVEWAIANTPGCGPNPLP